MLYVFDVRQGLADGYNFAAVAFAPAPFEKPVYYYQVNTPNRPCSCSLGTRIPPHPA
jgi:hypothetical protein